MLGPGQAVTPPQVAEGGDTPPPIPSPRFFWLAIDTWIEDIKGTVIVVANDLPLKEGNA